MREILFRGKAINRDNRFYRTNYKNGDWVYGLLESHKDDYSSATMINEDGVSNIDIDEETLGQYTGLCDKNGKKIFEGDIVKCDSYFNNPQLVKWNNEWCAFEPIFDARPIEAFPILSETNRIEVIGNIYDTPELLDGDNEKTKIGENL